MSDPGPSATMSASLPQLVQKPTSLEKSESAAVAGAPDR